MVLHTIWRYESNCTESYGDSVACLLQSVGAVRNMAGVVVRDMRSEPHSGPAKPWLRSATDADILRAVRYCAELQRQTEPDDKKTK